MKNMILMTCLALAPIQSFALSTLAQNKKIAQDFYELAFNQHQPKEAALKYLSVEYVQHNPHVASGRDAFIKAFDGEKDESKTIFKRLIAEDDLVVIHAHKIRKPGERGVAGIDIFRLKNGKITEHWDVNQAIPETSANENTMF